MIKIIVKKSNEIISEIEISGHADYADYGKDIVCAAVSSIAITTVNAIGCFEETIDAKDNSGLLIIRVKKDTEINQKLLNNMIEELSELVSQYPKNIEIRNED